MRNLFLFYKNLLFFFIFFWNISLISGEEKISEKIWRKINLENFEINKITDKNLRIKDNPDVMPEIKMSNNLTAPIPDTARSLLIRFPPTGNNFPVELIFPRPLEIRDFIKEFTFHIYSSGNGSRLFFYLMDVKGNIHKMFLCNLSFQGWRTIRVVMDTKFEQNDLVLNLNAKIYFIGFLIEPREKVLKDKEDILAIDDIFVTVRDKYKVIKKLDQLIE